AVQVISGPVTTDELGDVRRPPLLPACDHVAADRTDRRGDVGAQDLDTGHAREHLGHLLLGGDPGLLEECGEAATHEPHADALVFDDLSVDVSETIGEVFLQQLGSVDVPVDHQTPSSGQRFAHRPVLALHHAVDLTTHVDATVADRPLPDLAHAGEVAPSPGLTALNRDPV